jgi:hypothetical protein
MEEITMYSRVVRFAFFVLFLAIAVPLVANAGGPPCYPQFAHAPKVCGLKATYERDGVWTGRGSYGATRWAYKLTVKTIGEEKKKKVK